uniref:hypothetical protein n=1 Tax=Ganoderma multipileum TaxID=1173714 RepID=UPI001F13BE05|nr:hypothetical protein MN835_mgp03 [Ganoderma multipileum]ULO25602.1 hypothetical protein [Ganoderma multipileum]
MIKPPIYYIIILCGMCNIIYIQFNLMCRITLVIFKGLSYFKIEISKGKNENMKRYFIKYLIFNFVLIILSLSSLNTIYSYVKNFPGLNIIITYNLIISYILYNSYMYYTYEKIRYNITEEGKYRISILSKILL